MNVSSLEKQSDDIDWLLQLYEDRIITMSTESEVFDSWPLKDNINYVNWIKMNKILNQLNLFEHWNVTLTHHANIGSANIQIQAFQQMFPSVNTNSEDTTRKPQI